MTVGYVRVSTREQKTIRQEVMMRELGVDKLFIDKASGKDTQREQFNAMMAFIREGDTLVVESYSRLARSTKDLLNIVELLDKKKVKFISKKETVDTSTPTGRLILTIFAGLSQFEREIMLERQREGIEEAKKAGRYKGGKPIPVNLKDFELFYSQWKDKKITAVQAQKLLGLSPQTFYRRVKEYESGQKVKGT